MLIMSALPITVEMEMRKEAEGRLTEDKTGDQAPALSGPDFFKMARMKQYSVIEGGDSRDIDTITAELGRVNLENAQETEPGRLVPKAPIRPEGTCRPQTQPYPNHSKASKSCSIMRGFQATNPADFFAQQRQQQHVPMAGYPNEPMSGYTGLSVGGDACGFMPSPPYDPSNQGYTMGSPVYGGGNLLSQEKGYGSSAGSYVLPYTLPSPEVGATASLDSSPELARAMGGCDFPGSSSPLPASTGSSANRQTLPLGTYHKKRNAIPTMNELDQMLLSQNELPDELANFILNNSRYYTDSPDSANSPGSDCSSGTMRKSSSGNSIGWSPRSHTEDSEVSLPSPSISISSSPPHIGHSPTNSPTVNKEVRYHRGLDSPPTLGKKGFPGIVPVRTSPLQRRKGTNARDRLRKLIDSDQFEAGWAWAAKSWSAVPEAMCFLRDLDGDSILHRVVYHRDIAKTYALVEHMLKDENPLCPKPFDLPNGSNETPLFVAVQRRLEEVVAYLLECGANPNVRIRNRAGDASLHYAAARGMTEIVIVLCGCMRTEVNAFNVAGMTPLLCAVKYHGVIEEENQCLVNNKPAIRALLKHGADPLVQNSSSGKTVLHYAVERMDPDLIEVFKTFLPAASMRQLVNTPCLDGTTPMALLRQLTLGMVVQKAPLQPLRGEGEDELRHKVFATLVEAGADPDEFDME